MEIFYFNKNSNNDKEKNIEFYNISEKIKKLKEMKDKTQVNINKLELYRYNIIDLRREKRRIEKHLEKYKIIFE